MVTPDPSSSTAPSTTETTFTFKAAVFAVPFVISLAIVGIFLRTRVREVTQIEMQLQKEKEREKELAGVAAQNAEYQRLLEDLWEQVKMIEYLQSTHLGPVEFMSVLRKLVMQTADVDLNSFTPQGGRLVFRGRSHSEESTAHFLALLQGSGSFSDLQLRKFYKENGQNSTTYDFELECVYSQPQAAGGHPQAAPRAVKEKPETGKGT